MPKGMEIGLCIMGLILLRFARGRVLAMMAERYDPDCTYPGCGGTGTIWDGKEVKKCPRCG